jgi:hypothetical protein
MSQLTVTYASLDWTTVLGILQSLLSPFLDAADLINLAVTTQELKIFRSHLTKMFASVAILSLNHEYKWFHYTIVVNGLTPLPIFRRFFSYRHNLYPFAGKNAVVSGKYYSPSSRSDLIRQLEPRCRRKAQTGLSLGASFNVCDCFLSIKTCLDFKILGARISYAHATRCDLPSTILSFFGLERELLTDSQADQLKVERYPIRRQCPAAELPPGMVTAWRRTTPGSSLPIETIGNGQVANYNFALVSEHYVICACIKNKRFCGEPALFNREGPILNRRCESCVGLESETGEIFPRRWLTHTEYLLQKTLFPETSMCIFCAQEGENRGLYCAKLFSNRYVGDSDRCSEHRTNL